MSTFKSNIKEAISEWNEKNPTLRKKTLGSVAKELGVSTSALSQIDSNNSKDQFQKHSEVIFESDKPKKQIEMWNLYKKLDVPMIKRLEQIRTILGCQIYDLIKKV
jgi:hypothetical protein